MIKPFLIQSSQQTMKKRRNFSQSWNPYTPYCFSIIESLLNLFTVSCIVISINYRKIFDVGKGEIWCHRQAYRLTFNWSIEINLMYKNSPVDFESKINLLTLYLIRIYGFVAACMSTCTLYTCNMHMHACLHMYVLYPSHSHVGRIHHLDMMDFNENIFSSKIM